MRLRKLQRDAYREFLGTELARPLQRLARDDHRTALARLQLDTALRAWDEEGGLSAEEGIDQRSSQSTPGGQKSGARRERRTALPAASDSITSRSPTRWAMGCDTSVSAGIS
jgi:hypothetical protein